MKSQEAKTIIKRKLGVNFEQWRSVKEAAKDIDKLDMEFKKIEDKPGIYLIKQEESINRLEGDSDILYIGQGKLGDRLYGVFAEFFSTKYNVNSWNHDVKDLIYELVNNKGKDVYFTYCQCSKADAKRIEKEILESYKEDHLELPPWNYQV